MAKTDNTKKKEDAPAKKSTFSQRFYNLEEEEVQALIKEAQSGNETAFLKLLEVFDNFLTKYVTLLHYGKFSLEDQDVRKFVSLYIADPQLRLFVLRNTLKPGPYKAMLSIMDGIRFMINRWGTKDDIEQTVKLAFISCVNRYERRGTIPFSGFIYNYFFYLLKRDVDTLLIDQLGLNTFPLITDDQPRGDDAHGDERVAGFAPLVVEVDDLYLIAADNLDEYWVAGETALPPFDRLTVHERQLLRWRYVLGEKVSAIAGRISEHPNAVREYYKAIRHKLTDIIAEDVLD